MKNKIAAVIAAAALILSLCSCKGKDEPVEQPPLTDEEIQAALEGFEGFADSETLLGEIDARHNEIWVNLGVDEILLALGIQGGAGTSTTFASKEIEREARRVLGIESGDLTRDDFERVTELNLTGLNLRNIQDLGKFKNLVSLDLTANLINDISSLASLTKLEELSIGYNSIYDLSPLSGLESLRVLNAWTNRIEDISALAGMTSLTDVALFYNDISEIDALGALVNLETLDLSGNPVSDISVLSSLVNLKKVVLTQTAVLNLSPVSHVQTVIK